ncbi:MAG: glycosyltransferase family 4 protein [Candidatus Aminicenantales bacterium]
MYQNRIGRLPSGNKVALFPFGLQIDALRPGRRRERIRADLGLGGEFVIGTAARIDRIKRIEKLIEAFSLLPDKERYRLLILGSGDKAYLNELLTLTKKENLGDYVRFLGFREDAIDIVSGLDFFVLPSRNETFGLAILEAMALGIPCAVFKDAGGARDIIGDAGFVVETPAELSENIIKVNNGFYGKDGLSSRLIQRAREFDIERTADRFYNLYKELVQG